MTAQQKLERFYDTLKARAPADAGRFSWLLGPDLIRLDDQYLHSSPRVAIIGQEVHDWYYNYPQFLAGRWEYYYAEPSTTGVVRRAVAEYQGFDFGFSEKEPLQGTPFWQFFHEVRKQAFPSEPDAHRKVLWTNLVKFVAKDGSLLKQKMRYHEVEEAIQLQDDLVATELRIANPEVCIFVTGPSFDCILRRYFPGLRFEQLPLAGARTRLDEREFARLVHRRLPPNSYRTYHPNHLRRGKLWDKVFQILSQELGAWTNERSGVDAGRASLFAFQCPWPGATQKV
jgi:hypothetical protein